MLFLQFALGPDLYLLDTAQVVGVLALPELKGLPQAPAGVAGVMTYRGTAVPVIDLAALNGLGKSADRLSTRLVLVNHPTPRGPRWLGLVAERATQVIRLDASRFTSAGLQTPAAPWLGPVVTHERRLLQWIRVDVLLTAELQALLFPAVEEVANR